MMKKNYVPFLDLQKVDEKAGLERKETRFIKTKSVLIMITLSNTSLCLFKDKVGISDITCVDE